VAAEQLPSGAVLHVVPDPADHESGRDAVWSGTQGSAGWGDAIVHVPWELYRATGRTELLVPFVDAMRRWVDFGAARAADGRHPDRVAARPAAAPHERYLWDTGFHFGEWNEPGTALFAEEPRADEPEDGLERLAAQLRSIDHGATATAYLYRSAVELVRIADILNDDTTAQRYRSLADNVLHAWRAEYLDQDGRVQPATQPNLVRALAFGLLPSRHRAQAVQDLVEAIFTADTHVGTGFLATPFLLPVLAEHGQVDLAFRLLRQRTAPSWLAMREQGATTIWEGWTSVDGAGRVTESLNHFSMGAVIGFLHRYVAGLQVLEPGYRHFRVAPHPGPDITWATTHHDSPYGRIDVRWQLDGPVGHLDVTVPPGTTAEVALPPGGTVALDEGRHSLTWAAEAVPSSRSDEENPA
jgi:alpha-L-rhamnosidase